MTTMLLVAGIAVAEWAVLLYGVRIGERTGWERAVAHYKAERDRERAAHRLALRGSRCRCEPFAVRWVSRAKSARVN